MTLGFASLHTLLPFDREGSLNTGGVMVTIAV
jgi:hypothetical protein